MKPIEVADGIYMLTLNVEGLLFEEMWDMPNGVTLNSYIVKGEKTALIDGVCGWEGVPEQMYEMLDEIDVKIQDIDYLIINHMEPDHSGWIQDFEKLKPNFEIYCTKAGSILLDNFFGEKDRVNVVKPGDKIDLGGGKEIEFIPHPNVHWPDTMMSFEKSTGTLFSCDMFGSFGICEGNNFDDEFKDGDFEYFAEEEIRYYSNILSTFNSAAAKAVDKARALNPKVIAPGHGPIYRKNPSDIMDRYERIAKFLTGEPLEEVTVLYGSMYGMTEKAVDRVLEVLDREGIKHHVLKMPHTQIGEVLSQCMRSSGLILGCPTYENKMFPSMAMAIDELGRKKMGGKIALQLGSYGWGGGASKEMAEIVEKNKIDWEFLEEVKFAGSPLQDDYDKIEAGVMEMITRIRKR